jgi:hypothetical protein
MGQESLLKRESEPLAITAIGERFQGLRIVDPSAERTILNSMRQYGQLTPVVVCRLESGSDELLDGFKRLRAARSLAMRELAVSRLEMGPSHLRTIVKDRAEAFHSKIRPAYIEIYWSPRRPAGRTPFLATSSRHHAYRAS